MSDKLATTQDHRLSIGEAADGTPFTLPIELEVSTQAILAQRRSGKSYTASVQAEELLELGQQIGVIDPTGAWWGLRSSADGEKPGFRIAIFGGRHGDAPLDFQTGKAMAAAMVEHGFSAIFDISDFEFDQQLEFVRDFCAELLRLNNRPFHLYIDEADTYAPQLLENRLQKMCLGTVSRLIKQGGIGGLGCTLITQRPADINKKVLSQVQAMTVLRMAHKLDIDPVVDWIKRTVSPEFAKVVEAGLPTLPVGQAYFASDTLGVGGLLVKVRLRRTFNSGATPKVGEQRVEPKLLASINIKQLGREISESVKRAEEESPEFLKGRIAVLEAEIARLKKKEKPEPKIIEVPKEERVDMGFIEEAQATHEELVRLRGEHTELEQMREYRVKAEEQISELQDREDRYRDLVLRFGEAYVSLMKEFQDIDPEYAPKIPQLPAPPAAPKKAPDSTKALPAPSIPAAPRPAPSTSAEPHDMNAERRILHAMAEFEAFGRTEVSRPQLSAWARAKGGYFARTVSAMITAGLLISNKPGFLSLTAAGRSQAPKATRRVTADSYWEAVVAAAKVAKKVAILEALRVVYPNTMHRDKLSEKVKAKGGYFARTVSSMVTAGFLEIPEPGMLKLSPWTQLRGR